jgi:hypothetical protein
MFDKISIIDIRSRIEKTQARKCLAEFFNRNPNNVSFTKHALEQMQKRTLSYLPLIDRIKLGSLLLGETYEMFNVWK